LSRRDRLKAKAIVEGDLADVEASDVGVNWIGRRGGSGIYEDEERSLKRARAQADGSARVMLPLPSSVPVSSPIWTPKTEAVMSTCSVWAFKLQVRVTPSMLAEKDILQVLIMKTRLGAGGVIWGGGRKVGRGKVQQAWMHVCCGEQRRGTKVQERLDC
jgi:hypothetical protein